MLLVENLSFEMRYIYVFAIGTIQGLLTLLERVRTLAVTLLLQLQESREYVFDMLKDF